MILSAHPMKEEKGFFHSNDGKTPTELSTLGMSTERKLASIPWQDAC